MEAPELFAVGRIERRDESANAELAARGADDHLVLDDERRNSDRVARFRALERNVPLDLAAPGVQGEDVTVDGAHEEASAEHREPTIHAAVTDAGRRGRRV